MTIKMFIAAVGTIALLSSGVAYAQTPGSEATEKASAKPRSAKSMECSKQADAKGLHGKARKKFMSSCKKA